jgi:NADH dehydrogenase
MYDILIVGGGYAGVWAALGAARQLELEGRTASIALVTREPWLTARPRLYEHGLTAPDAQIALKPVLDPAGVTLVEAEVADIDLPGRRVGLADGRSLAFGTLVLAAGSVARSPAIDGFAAHGHGVDTWAQADRLWRELGRRSGSSPRVAIIGAGFTGLELATELAGWRDTVAPGARILLIDRATEPASGYRGEARRFILDTLAALYITVRSGSAIAAVTADSLVLANGETIGCDVAVWAGGLQPVPIVAAIAAPHAADGRLVTDRALRVADHLFAAGDVAAVPLADGHSTVMSCQHALSTGTFAGHNAARAHLGMAPVDYDPLPYVTCLDLGPAGALRTSGFERTLVSAGAEAKPVKQFINRRLIVPPVEGGRDALLAAAALRRERSPVLATS